MELKKIHGHFNLLKSVLCGYLELEKGVIGSFGPIFSPFSAFVELGEVVNINDAMSPGRVAKWPPHEPPDSSLYIFSLCDARVGCVYLAWLVLVIYFGRTSRSILNATE